MNHLYCDRSSPTFSFLNIFHIKRTHFCFIQANFIQPGKRPLSSICPVIALYKSDLCGRQVVLGGSGGSRITSAVIQVLFNMLTFDQSLENAIEWPRLHHQLSPMEVEVEGDKFSDKVKNLSITRFLEDRGNKVNNKPTFTAIVNGAYKYDGHLYGHADTRRNGGGAVVY